MADASASRPFSVFAAVEYAGAWWDGYDPMFPRYPNDCMNFVSQILYAGGVLTGPVWHVGGDTGVNTNDFYCSQRQWHSPDGGEHHFANSNNGDVAQGDAIGWDWNGFTSHTNPRFNWDTTV